MAHYGRLIPLKKTLIKYPGVILILTALLITSTSDITFANRCVIPENVTLTRPDPSGPPTEVSIGIFFIDIKKINDLEQTYTADIFGNVRWHDPRLSAASMGKSLEGCRIELDEIWNPQVSIINRWNVQTAFQNIVNIDESGNVIYRQRLTGNFSSVFDLRDFPFDSQSTIISLASFRYGPDEVKFIIDEKRTGMSEKFSLAGWSVEPGRSEVTSEYIKQQDRELSRLNHVLTAKRHTGYYLWKVILPLSLIVFMAGTVFWIDPSESGPQIGISTASVLTLIAFQFSLGYLLPRISYLTRIDKFMFGATFLVFLALAESVLTSKLSKKGDHDLAKRVDHWSQFAYILLFIAFSLLSFLV